MGRVGYFTRFFSDTRLVPNINYACVYHTVPESSLQHPSPISQTKNGETLLFDSFSPLELSTLDSLDSRIVKMTLQKGQIVLASTTNLQTSDRIDDCFADSASSRVQSEVLFFKSFLNS